MMMEGVVAACLLWPLVVGALVLVFGSQPNVRDTVMVGGSALLLPMVGSLASLVMQEKHPSLYLFDLLPGIGLSFVVEPLGLVYALVAASLWPVTLVYSVGYMRGHHEKNQTRFFFFFAVAISAAIGVAFSANLVSLFLFYEVLTISTYPLVTHHQDEAARTAGRVYLGILLTTSVCFLLMAICWTYVVAGTVEFRPGGVLRAPVQEWGTLGRTGLRVLLGLYAFGIGKAGLMPFHRWLPNAMVAPTPVSALLHAVAVVKAGVFSVLKVVVYIFGTDLLTEMNAQQWLMYVAGFTILMASTIAITKDNLKERLAYSTISQLAYIVLGAAMANEAGILGGGMHIATHAVGKITLFFCAGAIYVATHKKNISDMRGMGRAMPFTFGAFGIGAVSVIGLPPCGGAWSKWYLAMGALDTGEWVLMAVLMVSSLLNIAYLMPIFGAAFFLKPKEGVTFEGVREPILCVAPLCFTAALCVVLFFFPTPLYELLLPAARGGF